MNPGTAAANFTDATFADSPAAFHVTSGTFSFADGHVESHKWLDGSTLLLQILPTSIRITMAVPVNWQPKLIASVISNGLATTIPARRIRDGPVASK